MKLIRESYPTKSEKDCGPGDFGLYQILLNDPEIRALFTQLDARMREREPLAAAEHKLWEVMYAVLVKGEREHEMDGMLVRVAGESGSDAK